MRSIPNNYLEAVCQSRVPSSGPPWHLVLGLDPLWSTDTTVAVGRDAGCWCSWCSRGQSPSPPESRWQCRSCYFHFHLIYQKFWLLITKHKMNKYKVVFRFRYPLWLSLSLHLACMSDFMTLQFYWQVIIHRIRDSFLLNYPWISMSICNIAIGLS